MNIGDRLRILRLDMKKTLKEQSEAFGVSLNSIYRWEHGLTVPKRSTLKKMADYYGVPLTWLLQGDDSEESTDGSGLLHPETENEQQLLKMFRKLSDFNKYKILGYIERMCVEGNG